MKGQRAGQHFHKDHAGAPNIGRIRIRRAARLEPEVADGNHLRGMIRRRADKRCPSASRFDTGGGAKIAELQPAVKVAPVQAFLCGSVDFLRCVPGALESPVRTYRF